MAIRPSRRGNVEQRDGNPRTQKRAAGLMTGSPEEKGGGSRPLQLGRKITAARSGAQPQQLFPFDATSAAIASLLSNGCANGAAARCCQ